MKLCLIFLIFLLIFPLQACNKQEDKVTEISGLNFDDSRKAANLIESDTKFGFDLFRGVLKMNEAPENLMISPLGVGIALGMTYNGAEGTTKSAFEETLRREGFTRDEINDIHQTLIKYLLQADPKIVLEIASSIWYKNDFEVLQSFIDTNRIYYQAEVKDLDFGDPAARDVINSWVATRTHNKIQSIIDQIPSDVVMYLINAIYFNGTWKQSFNEKNTYSGTFTKEDKSSIQIRYMYMKATVRYLVNDLFSAVELPYGNGQFSMVFLVPAEGKSIPDVTATLDIDRFNALTTGFDLHEVKVNIPKFKFAYKELLNVPLTNMGLRVAFSDSADFRGINPDGGLLISRVIHKSFVDVNEKGTEAAAVTAVEIGYTSAGPSEVPFFKADKPFIFIIREKSSNAILFMGKVGKPEYPD